jgi:hypothetical protein
MQPIVQEACYRQGRSGDFHQLLTRVNALARISPRQLDLVQEVYCRHVLQVSADRTCFVWGRRLCLRSLGLQMRDYCGIRVPIPPRHPERSAFYRLFETSIALDPLEWIDRITSHIPDPGRHCQRSPRCRPHSAASGKRALESPRSF